MTNIDLVFPLLIPFFYLMSKTEEDTSYRVAEIFKIFRQKYLDNFSNDTKIRILEFISKQFVLAAGNPNTREAQREIIYDLRAKLQKTLFKVKINEYQPLLKKKRKITKVNKKNITKEFSDSDQEYVDDPSESEEEIPIERLL